MNEVWAEFSHHLSKVTGSASTTALRPKQAKELPTLQEGATEIATFGFRNLASQQASQPASKRASQPASKRHSQRADKHASKRAGKRASQRADKHASERAGKRAMRACTKAKKKNEKRKTKKRRKKSKQTGKIHSNPLSPVPSTPQPDQPINKLYTHTSPHPRSTSSPVCRPSTPRPQEQSRCLVVQHL